MSATNLRIKIKFFPLPTGKLMQVKLVDQAGAIFDVVPNSSNIAEIRIPVSLPATCWLEFSNKDHRYDTVVDSSNNIVEDLHVEILEVGLDCFDMSPHYLKQNLQLHTADQKVIHSNYIGFNGKMPILLQKTSVFQQIMQWSAP